MVRTESLNAFGLVFFRKETSRSDIGIDEHVDDWSCNTGDNSTDDENKLPGLDVRGLDVAETEGKESGHDGGNTVGRVPDSNSDRLFGSTVPLRGKERKERETTSFKQTQYGSRHH